MVRVRTLSGEPVIVAGVTVIPQARALVVRTRFGGLVWTRPVAVLVRRAGRVDRVPIVDVTRRVQLGLLIATTVAAVTLTALRRRRRRREETAHG